MGAESGDSDPCPGPAYLDEDGDGWGGAPAVGCSEEHVGRGGDCDDADPEVHPALPERCNGQDDDCDGAVDAADRSLQDRIYRDEDGDGFGAPASELRGCPSEGWVAAAGDCNDAAPEVNPLAVPECDAHPDTNCDGIEDVELDADGDGAPACMDCADDDPERSPLREEQCNGTDDDCDELVDLLDPSVNPLTCGECIDPGPLAGVPFERRTYNPCLIDAQASGLCRAPDANLVDTHESGRRLHRVVRRTDLTHHRRPLFLYLPPGKGDSNSTLLDWMAFAGYRVLSLGYVNDTKIADVCSSLGDECYRGARLEMLTGVDASGHTHIEPADAIVGRLQSALAFLAEEEPDVGWEEYLAEDGSPDWADIVVGGWSVGAGQAAFLAKYFPARGVVLFSGPKDRVELDETLSYAPWIASPSAVDSCRHVGAYHRDEFLAIEPVALLPPAWASMGMPFPPVDLVENPVDYAPAQVLQESHPPDNLEVCTPHNHMGRDDCLPPELLGPYISLACAADDGRFCPSDPVPEAL